MFEKELSELQKKSLLRTLLPRTTPQGPLISLRGRKYLNFSSNDYLGLADDPDLKRTAAEVMLRYGFGSGASRLLAGGTDLHEMLEKAVAEFKAVEASLLFNSGYAANTGAIPALSAEGDVLYSDELNHASIIDGCRLSNAKTVVYRHRDASHLDELLKKERTNGRKFVVTDSVFSMDGDIAPLPDIAGICTKYGAVLYIDDAHGTGVLGQGKGALAHFSMKPEKWMIQMGTFSKALGSFGAFVAADSDVTGLLINRARSFIFSTALPPCVIAAATAGLRCIESAPSLVETLWSNRERLYKGLKRIGYNDLVSATPILTVRTRRIRDALRLAAFLYEEGIYVPAIRPPAVREPRLRITVTAAHTEKQIDRLLLLLKKAGIGVLA